MSIPQLAPASQGHPCLAEQLTVLHEVLDGLLATEIGPGDAGCLGEVSRARARLDALRLRVIGAAEAGDVASGEGQASTADWVRKKTRSTGTESARDTKLARSLDSSRGTGPVSPTRAALEAGEISTEHARVITDALRRLPSHLTPEQRLACERRLVTDARRFDPAQLRRVARRILAEVEPDPTVVDAAEDAQVVDEEDHAYAAARLTFHDNNDGTTTGRFTLPSLQADILRKIINAMTAPRRTNGRDVRRARAASEHGSNPFERDRVDPDHARGLALAQLLEHLPTGHLHGAAATQVTVLMDIATLRGHLKAAGLDTDRPISAGEARRMACNSVVTGTTLSGKSLVLDLGRTSRSVPEPVEGQRHPTQSDPRHAHSLRRERLHPTHCVVRTAPPHRLGTRRQNRPRRSSPPLRMAPPPHPRPPLDPHLRSRRIRHHGQTGLDRGTRHEVARRS